MSIEICNIFCCEREKRCQLYVKNTKIFCSEKKPQSILENEMLPPTNNWR
jgi:hypothetical protein